MTRYLERADHASRVLANQFEALEDSPIREIDWSWRRIYASLSRTPSGGFMPAQDDEEEFMLADSYTLADDLTFEPSNPDSIRTCINQARENARQARHVVGKQTWSLLNAVYLNLKPVSLEQIWNNQPLDFYLELRSDIRMLFGVIDSTMYRDHGWHFIRLGRYLERVQLIASLIKAQIELQDDVEGPLESEWLSILKICEARLAYHRIHSIAGNTHEITRFLISDPLLSHSIAYSLSAIRSSIDSISGDSQENRHRTIDLKIDRMIDLIDKDSAIHEKGGIPDLEIVSEIRTLARELSGEIDAVYFNYGAASYD